MYLIIHTKGEPHKHLGTIIGDNLTEMRVGSCREEISEILADIADLVETIDMYDTHHPVILSNEVVDQHLTSLFALACDCYTCRFDRSMWNNIWCGWYPRPTSTNSFYFEEFPKIVLNQELRDQNYSAFLRIPGEWLYDIPWMSFLMYLLRIWVDFYDYPFLESLVGRGRCKSGPNSVWSEVLERLGLPLQFLDYGRATFWTYLHLLTEGGQLPPIPDTKYVLNGFDTYIRGSYENGTLPEEAVRIYEQMERYGVASLLYPDITRKVDIGRRRP